MITPTRYEIRCDAWDCDPERFTPWSRPFCCDAKSVPEATRLAKDAGWIPAPGRGAWWCPRHAQTANTRRAQLAAIRDDV